MVKIKKCSCSESLSLRAALKSVARVAGTDTHQDQYSDLQDIEDRARLALVLSHPGGEPPCSCPEALHLRQALGACVNVSGRGEGAARHQPIEDVAQCANFASQGLKLQPIEGDPGVYDASSYIPAVGAEVV